ncbi:hypothetical protein AAVH_09619 [Aphelenchoides avenae]|nr:hypothetical protein AAVH_09619 [Aphelenchus avenae]
MLTSPTNASKISRAVYILLALDILSGAGDLLLFLVNISAKKRKNEDYNLQKAYQLRENDVTLMLIFPLSAVHSVTYIVYLSTNMYIRGAFVNADVSLYITLLEAVHGLVCAYTSVPMIAFYFFLRRFEASYKPEINASEETDFYFKQFQMQMEAALPPLKQKRRLDV